MGYPDRAATPDAVSTFTFTFYIVKKTNQGRVGGRRYPDRAAAPGGNRNSIVRRSLAISYIFYRLTNKQLRSKWNFYEIYPTFYIILYQGFLSIRVHAAVAQGELISETFETSDGLTH